MPVGDRIRRTSILLDYILFFYSLTFITGPVIQEPVDTGNHHLDKQLTNSIIVYPTHEDPQTVQKADDCYYQTLGSG
jgi:hypothetical protein